MPRRRAPAMTLKRKFLLRGLVPVAGLVLTGVAALVGLLALRDDVHDALAGSQELRRADVLAAKLEEVGTSLTAVPAEPDSARLAVVTLNGSLPGFDRAMHGGWSGDDDYTRNYNEIITRAVSSAKARTKVAADLIDADPAGARRGEAAKHL